MQRLFVFFRNDWRLQYWTVLIIYVVKEIMQFAYFYYSSDQEKEKLIFEAFNVTPVDELFLCNILLHQVATAGKDKKSFFRS